MHRAASFHTISSSQPVDWLWVHCARPQDFRDTNKFGRLLRSVTLIRSAPSSTFLGGGISHKSVRGQRQQVAMDHAAYHVVYVDTRASRDLDGKHIHNINKGPSTAIDARQGQPLEEGDPECLSLLLGEIEAVRTNLKRLLARFHQGKDEPPSALVSLLSYTVHARLTCRSPCV